MKNVDKFLNRQKEKITSSERLEKKMIKRMMNDARKAEGSRKRIKEGG
jgi:hypothetical protein